MELNEKKEILQLQLHQMGRGQEQYVCVSARAHAHVPKHSPFLIYRP